MGLFDKEPKETKEEKQARKEQEMLAKYGLSTLTNPTDIASVKKIVSELAGTGMMEAGMTLSGGKTEDKLQVYYQRVLMEQNFVIIRQLDRIAKLLDK